MEEKWIEKKERIQPGTESDVAGEREREMLGGGEGESEKEIRRMTPSKTAFF